MSFMFCCRNIQYEQIDFTQLITKDVLSTDMKHLGQLGGLGDTCFIVKDGLFNPKYYKVPREKVKQTWESIT